MPYGKGVVPCHCHGCEEARAKPYRCRFCGYRGAPFVHPCSCLETKPDAVTTLGTGLRECEERGKEAPAAWYREQLAELLTDGPKLCAIDGRGQYCCHTDAGCPVCFIADDGKADWTDPENAHHAWRMIRAVRRLLEDIAGR